MYHYCATHLEVALFPDEGLRAYHHDSEDGHERHTAGVGDSGHQAELARSHCQQPLGVREVALVERVQRAVRRHHVDSCGAEGGAAVLA